MKKLKSGAIVSVKVPVGIGTAVLDPSMRATVTAHNPATKKLLAEFENYNGEQKVIMLDESNIIVHRNSKDYKPGEIEKKFKQFEKQIEASLNAWQRLRASERAFDKLRDELIELPEWEEWCKEKGWVTDLTFGGLGA